MSFFNLSGSAVLITSDNTMKEVFTQNLEILVLLYPKLLILKIGSLAFYFTMFSYTGSTRLN